VAPNFVLRSLYRSDRARRRLAALTSGLCLHCILLSLGRGAGSRGSKGFINHINDRLSHSGVP
jgi:hypothetical protein